MTDTLVLSRLIRADLKEQDYAQDWTNDDFPRRLHGSHSLKAWGYVWVNTKATLVKPQDWSEWSQAMQDYCEQDVVVTHKLWQHLQPGKWSQRSIRFEHELADICHRIGRAGWTFDLPKAGELYAQLVLEKQSIEDELNDLFPAWIVEEEFIPKRNNKRLGYVEGEPFIKQREVKFNPNSRKHIEHCLKSKYNWKPKVFTPSGDAKIDESTLVTLPFPEAQKLARAFMLQKRLGMLAEGKNAWMQLVDIDGKLRHTINPLGTVTGRASSFGPNLQQVPVSVCCVRQRVPCAVHCTPGFSLVGSDLAGYRITVSWSFPARRRRVCSGGLQR